MVDVSDSVTKPIWVSVTKNNLDYDVMPKGAKWWTCRTLLQSQFGSLLLKIT